MRTDLLEQKVWEEVCDLLQDQERLQQEYARRLNSPPTETENLSTIQSQQSKIQQGMARLIDSYAEGFVQKAEFEPRITRLRERLLELEQQVQQIQDQETLQAELQIAISRLEKFGEKVKDNLAEADWQMRRELIRMLVKRVEIGKEEIKVVFRIPPDPGIPGSDENSMQHCWKRDDAALRRTNLTGIPHAIFQDTRFEPLTDQFQYPPVANPSPK